MRLPPRPLPSPLAAVLLAGTLLAPGAAHAALSPITYDGLPLLTLPSTTNAAAAQVVGNAVVFSREDQAGRPQGFFSSRGGAPRALALPGDADPTPGATNRLRVFQPRFAVNAPANTPAFVFAAGETSPDTLFGHDGTNATRLLPPGAILPGSPGAAVVRYGAPHVSGDTLAVVASDDPEPGFGFQGVYRLPLQPLPPPPGTLTPVATTATELPGIVGIPDSFLDEVGFDGTTVVFQAARGPFDEPAAQGIFRQEPDGTPAAVIATGDPLPGGGTVAWLDFPPLVDRGIIAFIAQDDVLQPRIVRVENGSASVVARDGDPAPEGGTLSQVGFRGMVIDGPRTVFAARTAAGPGIYLAEGGRLTALVSGGAFPVSDSSAVIYPGVTLHAAEGSALVMQWFAQGGSPRDGLRAVLPQPAIPVIIATSEPAPVPLGGRLELKATVLGDPPLHFLWSDPSGARDDVQGDTLVIANATAASNGQYLLAVTNAFGRSALARFQVQVQAPPFFSTQPTALTVGLGDRFALSCSVVGAPASAIRWQRDGEFLVNPGAANTYGRNQSVLTDAGLYRAIATNAWGSATSTTARLTLRLPPPAPSYAGRRIEPLFANGLSVLSAGLTSLSHESIDPELMRWLDDRVALAGANPDGTTPAVFTHLAGSLTAWFRTGGPLPNNLGTLRVARVIPAANAADPLLILGGTNALLRGLYRIETTSLIPLADTTSPAPGSPGETFTGFPGPAAQAGNRVAFAARTATRSGVYAWADNSLRLLADTTTPLPAPATGFPAVGFDGDSAAILATTTNAAAGTAGMSLLRVTADGRIATLLATGDPIPGAAAPSNRVATLESPAVENGAIFFQGVETNGARHLLLWQDGAFTRLAGPGTGFGALGTVEAIETQTVRVDAGNACFTARLRTTSGEVGAILGASLTENGEVWLAPVVYAPVIDGSTLSQLTPLDLEGERLAFYAVVSDPVPRVVVYANTGTASQPEPQLRLEPAGSVGWSIPIPPGALLETTPALGQPWDYEPATGAFLIPRQPAPDAARFYRLRWP